MKKTKTFAIGIAVLLVAVACAVALVACGEEPKDPVIAGITLDTTGAPLDFVVGEAFTAKGVKVTAKYDDKSTKDVAVADCTVSEVDMTTAGEITVTVSYGGKSQTYKVSVVAPLLKVVEGNYALHFVKGGTGKWVWDGQMKMSEPFTWEFAAEGNANLLSMKNKSGKDMTCAYDEATHAITVTFVPAANEQLGAKYVLSYTDWSKLMNTDL